MAQARAGTLSGDVYTYSTSKGTTSSILNDNDDIWVRFRHQHIAEVQDNLLSLLKSFNERDKSQQARLAGQGGEEARMRAMREALRENEQVNYQTAKLNEHISLSAQCMDILGASDRALLNQIQDLEQSLATGSNPDGSKMDLAAMVDLTRQSIGGGSATSEERKLRLLLLLILTSKEDPSGVVNDFMGTMQSSLQPKASDAMAGLRHLLAQAQPQTSSIISADPTGKKSRGGLFSRLMKPGAAAEEEEDLDSARYICPLKHIIDQVLSLVFPTRVRLALNLCCFD